MLFQLALNSYLSTADGGELELWNLLPSDELYEAARYKTGTKYALQSHLLPDPDLVVRPERGDFIIFNAAKVHRVRPVLGNGARVTVSGFAGFFSLTEPFHLFS